MPVTVDFLENERIVGYVNIPSGSLLLVDGAFEVDLPLNEKHNLTLDLQLENTRLPIIATQQNGRRYLLIPIDSAQPLNAIGDSVDTTDQVPVEEKEKEDVPK